MKSYEVQAFITLRLSKSVTAKDADKAIAEFNSELDTLEESIKEGSPFILDYFDKDSVEIIGEDDAEPEDDRDRDERRGYYD